MTRRSEFVALVLEQMAGTGAPRVRAMFGGHGIYDGDVMFAIVIADTLYLKADDETRAEFEARGLRPFSYAARGRAITLTYFEAPPEVFEQATVMRTWMQKALGAALRAANKRAAPGTGGPKRKAARTTKARPRST
jgi:DNA transformation protein and related proteins